MRFFKTTFLIISVYCFSSYPQHRGDNLYFQGLNLESASGTRALAMGGAYASISGDVNSLFHNPAGLADINKFQITVSGGNYSKTWRENQNYRPNRYFVTLPFYLEGLYIPDPADNGRWDYAIAQDTSKNYVVNPPELGLDPFSKEAADWIKENNKFTFNNIAIAVPVKIGENNLVFSAGYYQNIIFDFDRNDTYLDPHLGYDFYGDIGRVNGLDTLVVKWSRYLRHRDGKLNNIKGAAAYNFGKYLKFGAGFTYIWGSSDDFNSLDRVGTFDLIRENRFRFYYQNVYSETTGTSDFSASKVNAGILGDLGKLKIGINVDFPFTLKRDWSDTEIYSDSTASSSDIRSGTDKIKFPAVFTGGLSFSPSESFTFSLDIEKAPFSKAEFSLATKDTMFRGLVDRTIIRFGAKFNPTDYLSILAGYSDIPQTFVPDGAAFKDKGPSEERFTAGIGLELWFGSFDITYELRRLKYYDSYFSNTNYVYETFSNLRIGYMYSFSFN